MSAGTTTSPTEQLAAVGVTYADLVEMNENALEEALYKIESGRIREPENE